jgi:outer membrane lipoprotein-sorting protein
VGALVAASGCASSAGPRDLVPLPPLRAADVGEVLAAYDAYCNGIETFSASGDVSIRDSRRGKSSQLRVRVVAARGGRLYLKASVAVVTGIEVISDGEAFWFQVPSRKKVWTGRNDSPPELADQEEPYHALRPLDVTGALVPEPMRPDSGQVLLLSGDRDHFELTLASAPAGRGVVARRAWLTRSDLRPFRAQSFDERGDVEADVVWRSWRDETPRDVTIVRPREGYFARFLLDDVDTNVEVPERAFSPRIPEGYELIEVES